MGDSLQRLGLNQLNHKLKVKRGGFEVTNGNISGSLTSTGSFGKLEVAGNSSLTGDLTIGGNITIGDADTDSLTISADLTSNLIPNADSTYDVGSSSKNWRYGYIEQLSATHITASNNVTATAFSGSTMELGSNLTSKGIISGSSVYGTTIGQNRTDGLKTITIEANSIINQDVSTDADATLGTLGVGNVTSTGTVSGSAIYGTTIGQNRTDGLKTITIEANSIINQDLSTDANATLGTLGVGNVTSTGTVSGSAVYGTTIGQNRSDGLKTITIEDTSTINQDVTTDATPTFAGINTTGNIVSQGDVIAENYIVSSSVTYMTQSFASGSNIFGDDILDTHQFTGSINQSGSFTLNSGDMAVTDTLTATNIGAYNLSGKLTAGSTEIEGSNFDINGGTIDGVSNVNSTGTITGSAVYGTTLGQNRVDGVKTITIESNSTINQDVTSDANVTFGTISSGNVTSTGTVSGSAVYGTTIGQNRSDGLKTITIEANSTVNQDLTTDADATLGTLAVGNVTSTGIVKSAGVLSGSSDAFFGQYGVSYISASNGSLQATNYISGSEVKAPTGTFGTATISAGTITGITDITVADGGTGASSLTDGGVLLGSGTDAITAMGVLSDGEMIVGDGSTDPVAESGATLRTSIGVGTGDSPQFTGVTATGTITGSSVYGTTIGQNRTDGIKTITIESDSIVNQDLTTDATPTFAGVTTSGDIVSQGDVIAENYIVSSSITYMTQSFSSGSTIFGDDISDNHRFTGSVNISGSINAISPETGSTTVLATNVQNGYPTSNFWGENLEGSYFNNFDNTTHVSEILRFMSGVLSASLDVADASPNTKTWASLTTTENSLGTADSCDGYLPQSYDSSNATLKYLVTKNWVGTGTKIFSGITVYHDNGPTYKVDFDSVVDNATKETVSSSADAQLFGLGGLTSGAPTQFDVRVVVTQSFSDTGSIATPTTSSNTFTTQSQLDVSMTSFGTTNGVELAKINTTQPAVIPAAYQDGKFADLGGTVMSGSLTRRYSGSAATFNDFTSVSASGYYSMHDLKVGIATGSGNFSYKSGATKTNFYAPVDQIESDIGSNTRGITNATQSYLSATSRSLSGVPYLIGATYHLSASVHGLFDPLYKDSSTIADDTIGSVGVGSVAGSGIDDMSTSGGTIQTANAVFSDSGSSPTVRSTGTVPYRTDIYKHNATYTLSGTTGENINQTGVSDSTFTVGVRGRNRANSRSTLATYTFFYHSGSTFAQPADSGSMAVYQRVQGYDGGSLAGTSEAFTGEDFRIVLDNNVIGFNGTAWTTTYEINQLGSYDLQVKPGYLVDPGGDYRYWYYEDYNDHGTYKYYIRRFQTSGTKTSMTVDIGKTLVNWNSTSNGSAVGLIFKSAASGSGGNTEQSVCRLYDPSDLTSNLIESSISNDNHKNPFTTAINLYGNTGGSKSTTEYTVPMRNSDGMYLDATDNELYVLVRYKGDESPITAITMTFT